MQEFDPYYYFLGIPRTDQPPDHYRILGVERFEADLQILEMAADRQMGHLQRHESGDHADDVARLLNEVARARLCLLNADKKAAYDAELRRSAADARTRDSNASNIIDAEIIEASPTNAVPVLPPPAPDQLEPKSAVLPAFDSSYKRQAPTCYFCGQRDSSVICSVEKPMYGNVRRVRTAWNTYRATWDSEAIKVPRCPECLKHHQRLQKITGGGLLLGLIIGAVGFLSILAMGPGGLCVGIFLALIGGTIGAVVGFAIANTETPYKMKQVYDVAGSERIRRALAKGWKRGKKPSQIEQQNAPIAGDESVSRTQSHRASPTSTNHWNSRN